MKMKLNELKVNSFVTKMEEKSTQTVKGGNFSVIVCPEISNVITQCAFGCITNDYTKPK